MQLETGAATVPNARATEVTLYDGLVATSVNAWPSVDFDLMAVAGLFARFMPAGFYYKTFMWPKSLWKRYEHYIRKASGLGTAPTAADPDRYDRMNAHCDVLVVGGGPAGLAAALAAGNAGARVMLVDEQSEFGGNLLSQRDVASVTADPASDGSIGGASPMAWVAQDRRASRRDARRAPPAAQHRVRLSRPELPHDRRAPDRSSAAGGPQGAARARVARAREAGGARDGRDGAAARLREQRSPRRDAGLGGVRVRESLRRPARHARGRLHQQRQRLSDRASPCHGGHRSGGRRRRAPGAARRAARTRAQGRHRSDRPRRRRRCPRHAARRGRRRDVARRERHRRHGSGHHLRVRSPRDLGRLEPDRASARAIGRQAALRRREGLLRPGNRGAGGTLRRRRQRQFLARRLPRRR